jgi:hypothetical protein
MHQACMHCWIYSLRLERQSPTTKVSPTQNFRRSVMQTLQALGPPRKRPLSSLLATGDDTRVVSGDISERFGWNPLFQASFGNVELALKARYSLDREISDLQRKSMKRQCNEEDNQHFESVKKERTSVKEERVSTSSAFDCTKDIPESSGEYIPQFPYEWHLNIVRKLEHHAGLCKVCRVILILSELQHSRRFNYSIFMLQARDLPELAKILRQLSSLIQAILPLWIDSDCRGPERCSCQEVKNKVIEYTSDFKRYFEAFITQFPERREVKEAWNEVCDCIVQTAC